MEKAAPGSEHASAQGAMVQQVGYRFNRKPGGRWPGGWWFFTELDVRLGQEVLRPDVCGFRRERLQQKPTGRPVTLAPG